MAMYEFNKSGINKEGHPLDEAHGMVRLPHSPEPPRHPAPHMRRQVIRITFEDKDAAVFQEVFGDADTAAAAMDILSDAPPEIQILALQILHMIEQEVA